jgi:hypothetical protein
MKIRLIYTGIQDEFGFEAGLVLGDAGTVRNASMIVIPRENAEEFEAWLRRGRQKGDRLTISGTREPAPDPRQRNLFDEVPGALD